MKVTWEEFSSKPLSLLSHRIVQAGTAHSEAEFDALQIMRGLPEGEEKVLVALVKCWKRGLPMEVKQVWCSVPEPWPPVVWRARGGGQQAFGLSRERALLGLAEKVEVQDAD